MAARDKYGSIVMTASSLCNLISTFGMAYTTARRTFSPWTGRPSDDTRPQRSTVLPCHLSQTPFVGRPALPQRRNLSKSNRKYGSSGLAPLVYTNSTSFRAMPRAYPPFLSTIHSGSSILRSKHGPGNKPHNARLCVLRNGNGVSTWIMGLCDHPRRTTPNRRRARIGLSNLMTVLLPTS